MPRGTETCAVPVGSGLPLRRALHLAPLDPVPEAALQPVDERQALVWNLDERRPDLGERAGRRRAGLRSRRFDLLPGVVSVGRLAALVPAAAQLRRDQTPDGDGVVRDESRWAW